MEILTQAHIATCEFNEEIRRHEAGMCAIRERYQGVIRDVCGLSPGDYVSFDGFPEHESNLSLGLGVVESKDSPFGVFDGYFGKLTDKPARFSVHIRLLKVSDLEISKSMSRWVNVVDHNLKKITKEEFESRVRGLKTARGSSK